MADKNASEIQHKAGEEGEAKEKKEEGSGEGTGEVAAADTIEGENEALAGEAVANEAVEGEGLEGEAVEYEGLEGEGQEGEGLEGEGKSEVAGEEKEHGGEEEEHGEEMIGEELEGEQKPTEEVPEKEPDVEIVEEEEGYVEEPPPDPAAPYDFRDSQEALKAPFELRPDQLAEVEQLWEAYQNYTPAYSDLDGYVTEKELFYMLKALLLMTFTPEQFHELIDYCCRPPHPEGHITLEQFIKMVTIRQRDFPQEEELRNALFVFDPQKTGLIDREYIKEVLSKQGHKMPQRQLDNLIKEVDLSNDGTIGVEDVVGTMCIDLNKEDLILLRQSLEPPAPSEEIEEPI